MPRVLRQPIPLRQPVPVPWMQKPFSSDEERRDHYTYCHLEASAFYCRFCDADMAGNRKKEYLEHMFREHGQCHLLLQPSGLGMDISEISSAGRAGETIIVKKSATAGIQVSDHPDSSIQHFPSMISGSERFISYLFGFTFDTIPNLKTFNMHQSKLPSRIGAADLTLRCS